MQATSRRMVRAGMTAAALMLMTVAGHTAAGGRPPDALGLVIAAALALGITVATSAHRPSAARLLALLLGGQALLHVILTLASGHAHGAATGPGTAPMVAAHVLASVAATALLLHADDLVDRWQALLASALGRTRPVLPALLAAPRLVTVVATPRHALDALLHEVSRRGPPAFATA